MTSIRHNSAADTRDAGFLDAARAVILDVGWSRATLTDIARKAGVSRMTIYRRWPDMSALMADLMTREWADLVRFEPTGPDQLERIADGVCATVRAIRDNPLFQRILDLDPELVLPYLLERRGRSQDLVIGVLTAAIREGQRAGEVRAGDPDQLARSVLLAAHGFALSAHTMGPVQEYDDQLHDLVERFLRL